MLLVMVIEDRQGQGSGWACTFAQRKCAIRCFIVSTYFARIYMDCVARSLSLAHSLALGRQGNSRALLRNRHGAGRYLDLNLRAQQPSRVSGRRSIARWRPLLSSVP